LLGFLAVVLLLERERAQEVGERRVALAPAQPARELEQLLDRGPAARALERVGVEALDLGAVADGLERALDARDEREALLRAQLGQQAAEVAPGLGRGGAH